MEITITDKIELMKLAHDITGSEDKLHALRASLPHETPNDRLSMVLAVYRRLLSELTAQ